MTRRRLFALAGGASAAATLPDIAAPIVEMHANDVAPLPPSAINDLLRGEMIVFREDSIRRMEWIPLGEPVIWSWRT
jgi:hypothetical protein